ncbi:MAG: acyl-CoA dehydrogenase [Betaproteobacteria bacterium]|nr:acyl-CoA dehydrogenase [Betaproteobacteria bacterium]NCV56159.1 acyl-CoA dehydrogenase [Betaproteobacteria bacterium]NCZ59319.1 acyl-CoA dehydrogenase [Betaproteobacteria bacterium]NCZ82411.1 acyl-CoA dehydrogenase [Betaproteobacteria bacterium]NDA24955.1 acyl-CoA dehydrogenase [Betaproteobacteria bacterium]
MNQASTMQTPSLPVDLQALRAWLGRTEVASDCVEVQRVQQLAASFDLDHHRFVANNVLPPLWHWCFATPISAMHQAGPDGHSARGGFLPPVPLPRRMWAGSRLHWHDDFRIGDPINRESRVVSVESKTGRSGSLVFVTVGHQWKRDTRLVLSEEHDIVYRDIPQIDTPIPLGPYRAPVWPMTLQQACAEAQKRGSKEVRCTMQPDEVLLFRYSALSFNSHKIHYDRRHCLEIEKYPGLIVHGPLMACLMGTLAWYQSNCQRPTYFAFRALSPVYDGEVIEILSLQSDVMPEDSLLANMLQTQRLPSGLRAEFAGTPDVGLVAECAIQKADGSKAMTAQMAW